MPPRSKTSLRVFRSAFDGTSYPAPANTPSALSCNRPLGMAMRMSSIRIVDGEREADGRGALAEAFVEIVVAAASGEEAFSVHTKTDSCVVAGGLLEIVQMKDELAGIERTADRFEAR